MFLPVSKQLYRKLKAFKVSLQLTQQTQDTLIFKISM